VLALATALAMVFFYAPNDRDEGFVFKIFYIHVPMAIVALGGFVAGGIMAVAHLRSGDERWDFRSYVAIHMSLILAIGALITGSIWARAEWGVWWEWREPTLVSFLLVFLLYATYQPLRFAIEDRQRQSRYASVFAITAGAFVPLSFGAVRLATPYIHPRLNANSLGGAQLVTFYVSLLAIALLFLTLFKYELTAKHTRAQIRSLKRKLAGEDPSELPVGRSAAPSLTIATRPEA
jgi:heme exporter protein C